MKNALIVFALILIISPSIYSTAMVTTNQKSTQEQFMSKFEPAYKLKQIKTSCEKEKAKRQIFHDLFEKIHKK
mgnify:CR=1 FL=1